MTTREQREKEIGEKVTPTVGNHECDWWWDYGGLVSYLADLEERIEGKIPTASQEMIDKIAEAVRFSIVMREFKEAEMLQRLLETLTGYPSQRIQMEENRKIAGKNTEGVI